MKHNDEIFDSKNESIYAYNSEEDIVFIDDVPIEHRGLRGDYFCLGCQKQMQAVLPKTKRQKYFRHHVSKNHSSQCTYSQETHRHFLAKAFLQELNKIKVPSVIKFSETNKEEAYLIKEAHMIEASSVVTEKAIYEDENGKIKFINKDEIDKEKYLYIIPDAILLDPKGKPKLIVEFVATHKPDQHKLMTLKRLGIDAVQVNVPKSSPEEIKKSLLVTSRTKWIYNNEEQNTEFISISAEDSRRVHEIDDLQRRLFEEGYTCRSAQIGELIRSVEKLLVSESYYQIEHSLRSEIQRITKSSERIRPELDEVREQHIRKGIERHQKRRTEFEISAQKLRNRYKDLEQRYNSKRSKVEAETRRVEDSITTFENEPSVEELTEREQEKGRSLESRFKELSRENERLPDSFERDKEKKRGETISEEERIEETTQRIRRNIAELEERGNSLSGIFERDKEEEQRRLEESTKRNTRRRDELRTKRESLDEIYRRKEEDALREIREDHRRRRDQIIKSREKLETKYREGNFEETTGNRFFQGRISKLIECSRYYSTHLFIYRQLEKENPT